MATYEQAISAVLRFKTEANKYQPILPVNTTEDSYYNMDQNVTAKEVLDQLINYKVVTAESDIQNIFNTYPDVDVGTIIKVSSTGAKYRVTRADSSTGSIEYEVVSGKSGGYAGSSSADKIIIKTYTSSDTVY